MADIQKRSSANNRVRYTARVRLKGAPTQTATFDRLTDARKWAQQIEADIRAGRHINFAEGQKHTLSEAIERYVKEILPLKPKSYVAQLRHLTWWKTELGHCTLSKITSALIIECRNKLKQGKVRNGNVRSPSTVNRYMAALSHLFSVASRQWEWLDVNPVKKITRYKEPRGIVRFLSDDERERLLAACQQSENKYLYLIVVLALSTGARQQEILGLKWQDVDFNRQVIVLHETKNKERRVLPICGKALELIKAHAKLRRLDTDLLFPSPTKPQQPILIRKSWDTAIRRAKIEHFRFHDLRHSAASYLAMNGATTQEIADVLGHKTLQMVKRYSHLSDSHIASVVGRMNKKIFG